MVPQSNEQSKAVVHFPWIPSNNSEDTKRAIESVYGDKCVLNVELHFAENSTTKRYALVTFKSAKIASKVLSVPAYWPNGCLVVTKKIKCNPSDPCDTVPFSYLEELNSDCLLHLYQYLTPADIASLSDASHNLGRFAGANIYWKYSDLRCFMPSRNDEIIQIDIDVYNRIFKHFGQYVKRCTLCSCCLHQPSVDHIRIALSACPNLEHLHIHQFNFSGAVKVFLHINKLTASEFLLTLCSGLNIDNGWEILWAKWDGLRSLVIRSGLDQPLNTKVLGNLKNLEKLSLADFYDSECEIISNCTTLRTVLTANGSTLKHLSLIGISHIPWQTICGQLYKITPNLVQLKIHVSEPHMISQFPKLKKLKSLTLCSLQPTGEFGMEWNMGSFKTLTELDLIMFNHDFIVDVSKLRGLRVLYVRMPVKICPETLIDTVAGLPNLKHLHLSLIITWQNKDTIKLLAANPGVEEIVLDRMPLESNPTVEQIVECLTSQQVLLEGRTRPVLRITIITGDYYWKYEKDQTVWAKNRKMLEIRYVKHTNCFNPNEMEYNRLMLPRLLPF